MKCVKAFGILALVFAASAQQGTEPKASADEYPVHTQLGDGAVGAEYMVHSFSRGQAYYLAKDYLVVEVALFPAEGKKLEIHFSDFQLRINGRKPALLPVAPEMVASSLDHAELSDRPRPVVAASVDNRTVVLGAPPQQRPPYPTDPRTEPRPIPRVPQDDDASGIEHPAPERADVLVVDVALPEGPQERKGPVSGYLYFAYSGRTSSIKSLELLYGPAVLKLK